MYDVKDCTNMLKLVKTLRIFTRKDYNNALNTLELMLKITEKEKDKIDTKVFGMYNLLNKYEVGVNSLDGITYPVYLKGTENEVIKSGSGLTNGLNARHVVDVKIGNFKEYIIEEFTKYLNILENDLKRKAQLNTDKQRNNDTLLFLLNTDVPDTEGRYREYIRKYNTLNSKIMSQYILTEVGNLQAYLSRVIPVRREFSGTAMKLFYSEVLDKSDTTKFSKFQKFEYYRFIDENIRRNMHCKMSMLAEVVRREQAMLMKRGRSLKANARELSSLKQD